MYNVLYLLFLFFLGFVQHQHQRISRSRSHSYPKLTHSTKFQHGSNFFSFQSSNRISDLFSSTHASRLWFHSILHVSIIGRRLDIYFLSSPLCSTVFFPSCVRMHDFVHFSSLFLLLPLLFAEHFDTTYMKWLYAPHNIPPFLSCSFFSSIFSFPFLFLDPYFLSSEHFIWLIQVICYFIYLPFLMITHLCWIYYFALHYIWFC